MEYENWMREALKEAEKALQHGDVPVGAVVVLKGEIIASRHNERELTKNPGAHAEFLAISDAAQKIGDWRLEGASLVSTLEPCPMCAGAIWAARLPKVIFGAFDPKAGALGSLYNLGSDTRLNHQFEVIGGVSEEQCSKLLSDFFAQKRK